MSPELQANVPVLIAGVAALAVALVLSPPRMSRAGLVTHGGGGLVGIAAITVAPSLDVVALVVLALGVLHAASGGRRDFAVRVRLPVVAAGMLALALFLAHVNGPAILDRFAGVGLVAALAAAAGVFPYVPELDPDEPAVFSPIGWIGFVGPAIAIAIVLRARDLLTPDAGGAFGAMLIGLGILNVAWGTIASWRTEGAVDAWRYSFMADWGLALCAFGLFSADARAAALLLLVSVIVARLPLYLASRQALGEKILTDQPVNLVVAAVLAGSAPFTGFVGRVLLFRAATQLYWPLALVLALGMLLWLPGSLRLGRSLGVPRGRQAFGVGIVVAVNVALGLYPAPLLALAGQ